MILAVATPSASDVEAAELRRTLAPYMSYTQDGRAYAEFAPTVETKSVSCARVSKTTFDCQYETRKKGYFDAEFAPWETKRERIVRKNRCWQIASTDR